ncbi:MAG TPA: CHAT domain-containing protein [Anaerolineae bacterium]|nr:CHAT domain-containing protein [Anaerolineae bacterium]
MTHSLSHTAELTCPHCNHAIKANVWLIVDVAERPDLLEKLREDTLHDIPCPHCGNEGQVDASVLVYRPGQRPVLIFSPAQQTTQDQAAEQAGSLLKYLSAQLATHWQDAWIDEMPVAPRSVLPALLSDDPKAAVRQMAQEVNRIAPTLWQFIEAGSWADRQRILERHPELLNDEADELLGLLLNVARDKGEVNDMRVFEVHRTLLRRCRQVGVKQAFAERTGTVQLEQLRRENPGAFRRLVEQGQQFIESTPLMGVIEQLVHTDNWFKRWQIVSQHPELLSDEALELLDKLVNGMRRVGEQNAVYAFEKYSTLLHRCRQVGIDRAFGEETGIGETPAETRTFFHALQQLSSEQPEMFQEFLDSDISPEQLMQQTELRDALDRVLSIEDLDVPVEFRTDLQQARDYEKQYQQFSDMAMLDQTVAAWQRIVKRPDFAAAPPDFRADIFDDAARSLMRRYGARGQRADLERAVELEKQAVELALEGSPDHARYLSNLGCALHDRYMLTSEPVDLEDAVAMHEQAVALVPKDSPNRAGYLDNLGNSLFLRYTGAGSLKDLERAVEASMKALELIPEDSPDRAGYLSNLGTRLSVHYDETGRPADLERAVLAYRQAVEITPEDTPNKALHLNGLGAALLKYYERTGQLDNLEQAIGASEQAVKLTPEDSPDYAKYLSNLGNGLGARYTRLGIFADLERSIAAYQQAVELLPRGSYDRASYLSNLAIGLRARYERRGAVDDLEQAIALCKEAVALTPEGSPSKVIYLGNLGNALGTRYRRTRSLDDLDQAIEVHQRAAELASEDSPDRAQHLSNLGNSLRVRHTRTGVLADLDRAIDVCKRAVALTPEGLPGRAMYLYNLGAGYGARYARTRALADLEQAITASHEAVELTPKNSPDRVGCLNNLGIGLRDRYARKGAPTDLKQAIVAFQSACQLGLDVLPEAALTTSRTWGRWAIERAAWPEAAKAYGYGRQAIEQLWQAQVLRAGKQAWLREAQTLFSQAAYARAKNGEIPDAVTTLEMGRTRLLAEAVERYRADLELLPQRGQRQLYEHYVALTQRLVQLESSELRPENLPTNFDLVEELRPVRAELDAVIAEIQQIPGYEDFFRAPNLERIQHELAADNRCVGVYLTITEWGGLALIVQPSGVKEMWLDLTEDEVNGWLLKREGEDIVDGYLYAQLGRAPLKPALNDVLPLLGDRVMQPIAEALKSLGVSDVTLIPCGRLALFPLHAAEYRIDGQVRRFIDEFTVMYTPSARALGSSREALATLSGQQLTLLGVGNPLPLPEDMKPLVFARPELEEITPLFNEQATVLYEQDAARTAVDAQLGATLYLHLSCHGKFNPVEPLESGVVLSNGEMITLRDLLARQRLSGTRLVVLSACQTAITDFNELPEEAIGLPAGFLQAGVPGVVGTLWPVYDFSTALLMIKFYEYHLKGDARTGVSPMQPAVALRQAQLWLREATKADLTEVLPGPFGQNQQEKPFAHPYYWAPFVFYGA